MVDPNQNADYSKYTFEDFLQDDFFLSSIRNNEGESVAFWTALKAEDKINWEAFCAARNFLESLNNQNDSAASSAELIALWRKIKKSNQTNSYRLLVYMGSCVAASILLLLAFPYLRSMFQSHERQDIMHYAMENNIRNTNEKIQIVLSKDSVVGIDEKETNIVYDSTQIIIAQKGISKKEATAYNQLIVPKGKRSNLTLSDGTKLVVNAGTRVVYPVDFTKNEREIYVDGEIFIEVSHDKDRPFTVKTRNINILALGTKFNVMAYESDQKEQVVLTKGSVKISASNKSKGIVLSPSEMYEYSNGAERIAKVDASYYTSWVDGVYIFESQKLADVMTRLSRYYGIDILYDADVAQLKCSGKMDLKDNLEDILKGLSFSFPIKVEHTNNHINIKRII